MVLRETEMATELKKNESYRQGCHWVKVSALDAVTRHHFPRQRMMPLPAADTFLLVANSSSSGHQLLVLLPPPTPPPATTISMPMPSLFFGTDDVALLSSYKLVPLPGMVMALREAGMALALKESVS